jgi:hypothetical protein
MSWDQDDAYDQCLAYRQEEEEDAGMWATAEETVDETAGDGSREGEGNGGGGGDGDGDGGGTVTGYHEGYGVVSVTPVYDIRIIGPRIDILLTAVEDSVTIEDKIRSVRALFLFLLSMPAFLQQQDEIRNALWTKCEDIRMYPALVQSLYDVLALADRVFAQIHT